MSSPQKQLYQNLAWAAFRKENERRGRGEPPFGSWEEYKQYLIGQKSSHHDSWVHEIDAFRGCTNHRSIAIALCTTRSQRIERVKQSEMKKACVVEKAASNLGNDNNGSRLSHQQQPEPMRDQQLNTSYGISKQSAAVSSKCKSSSFARLTNMNLLKSGVSVVSVSITLFKSSSTDRHGIQCIKQGGRLRLHRIEKNGPFDINDIQSNMILNSINGSKVTSNDDFSRMYDEIEKGPVTFKIVRSEMSNALSPLPTKRANSKRGTTNKEQDTPNVHPPCQRKKIEPSNKVNHKSDREGSQDVVSTGGSCPEYQSYQNLAWAAFRKENEERRGRGEPPFGSWEEYKQYLKRTKSHNSAPWVHGIEALRPYDHKRVSVALDTGKNAWIERVKQCEMKKASVAEKATSNLGNDYNGSRLSHQQQPEPIRDQQLNTEVPRGSQPSMEMVTQQKNNNQNQASHHSHRSSSVDKNSTDKDESDSVDQSSLIKNKSVHYDRKVDALEFEKMSKSCTIVSPFPVEFTSKSLNQASRRNKTIDLPDLGKWAKVQVLDKLGEGVYGSVWKCKLYPADSSKPTTCAVKVQIPSKDTSLSSLSFEFTTQVSLAFHAEDDEECPFPRSIALYTYTDTDRTNNGGLLFMTLESGVTVHDIATNAFPGEKQVPMEIVAYVADHLLTRIETLHNLGVLVRP